MSGENIKTKVCSKCGKELPMTAEYFYKHGDRYQSLCKECDRKRNKEYYETHKDRMRDKHKEYYETHKGQICERVKKYDKVHKERRRQYDHARWQLKRDEFFAKWKKPCQKCGEQRLYLIQFHHIDPATKEFDIGPSVAFKKTEICEEEVKKCVCLCSNCHDEFHYFYGFNPDDPVKALKEYLNN